MIQRIGIVLLMVVIMVGQLMNAYRLSGKKIQVIHNGIPINDIVDLDNRLELHDVEGVKDALRPQLLTENSDERLMLQQNGIEDFDTLDATVEAEKPPPKPIEATLDEDENNLTDDEVNKKAENLPEYNTETRADFEGNQEAADWLMDNPNTYNLKPYEDTLSSNEPDSMNVGGSEDYDTNNMQRKAGRHKHYKSQTINKNHQDEEVSDRPDDKGSNNIQTLYSFDDLNQKDAEEEDKENELEDTDNTTDDDSYGDDYEHYKTPHKFEESDITAAYNDDDHRDNEDKDTASKSNKNDDQTTDKEEAEENADYNSENNDVEENTERRPKLSKKKPNESPHSKNGALGSGEFDTDGRISNDKTEEGSGDATENDLEVGTVSSNTSGENELSINVDSKTKSFRLGNMTVHIRLSNSVKEHEASSGPSGISGKDKDNKSTELSKHTDEQRNNDLNTPNILQTSTDGHSNKKPSNSRHKLGKVLDKASHHSLDSQRHNKDEDDKKHVGTTSVHSSNSNPNGSGSQSSDYKIDLKDLNEELNTMEELMTLLQKNKETKIHRKTSLSPQKQKKMSNKSQPPVSMEREETATRRKQESRPEDVHDTRFAEWNGWSECSVTCGKGVVVRARVCQIYKCPDKEMVQTKVCGPRECPGEWERESLDAQNRLRARHHSPALEWSASLATKAQVIANQMAQKHFVTLWDLREQNGENIAQLQGTDGSIAERAAEQWYREIKSYSFSYPKLNEETRHFVQMIWKETRKIGMASAKSPNGEYSFVVALYNPPAVNSSRLRENILRPGTGRDEDVYSTFRRSEMTKSS